MMDDEIKITSSVTEDGVSETKITGLSAEQKARLRGTAAQSKRVKAAKAFGTSMELFNASMKKFVEATGFAVSALGGLDAILLDICERAYRETPWYRPLAKWRAWRDLKRARSSAIAADTAEFYADGSES